MNIKEQNSTLVPLFNGMIKRATKDMTSFELNYHNHLFPSWLDYDGPALHNSWYFSFVHVCSFHKKIIKDSFDRDYLQWFKILIHDLQGKQTFNSFLSRQNVHRTFIHLFFHSVSEWWHPQLWEVSLMDHFLLWFVLSLVWYSVLFWICRQGKIFGFHFVHLIQNWLWDKVTISKLQSVSHLSACSSSAGL